MIFRHKRTQGLYRTVLWYFDTARQKPHVAYVSLENGQVFGRDCAIFEKNFELVNDDPQGDIQPKPPHD